jgi:GDP-L-fucose synthase
MTFYKGKKVLVTGGTGMIGVQLVKKLVEKGADVSVVSLDSEERAKFVLPPEASFSRCNLTIKTHCDEATRQKDFVFHVAGIKGSVSLGRSKAATWFTPLLQFNTNMQEAAFKNGVERYLYTSSIGVYPEDTLFKEDNAWNGPPFSVDVYPGWAKRIGELHACAYKEEHGWDKIAIVRPANVYGPYDNFDPKTAMVVGALVYKFANCNGEKVSVWGDGTAIRDFIFSEDVADGMMLALQNGANCIPLNIASGLRTSIRELAETLAEKFGYSKDILEFDTSQPTGESIRLMDVSRAKETIGFTASTSIKDGISKTVDWYMNNQEINGRHSEL